MNDILKFLILSIPVIYFSRRNILHPGKHGFFRFFGWEGMVWIFVKNYHYWFINPLSINHIISWILLIVSLYLVLFGGLHLVFRGKPSSQEREDQHLFGFEKTTELVDSGVYKYIRHPLYASLIYLSWGMVLKNPTVDLIVISLICSILFYLTARYDEKECLIYFGENYAEYMKHSKMFIPFIF